MLSTSSTHSPHLFLLQLASAFPIIRPNKTDEAGRSHHSLNARSQKILISHSNFAAMARTKSNGNGPEKSSANLGFEAKLWLAADQAVPAPNRDAAECIGGRAPAPGLGLIFLNTSSTPSTNTIRSSSSAGARRGGGGKAVKPVIHVIFLVLYLALAAMMPAQPAGGISTWTRTDGQAIQAGFLRLEGDAVVVLRDGNEFTIPFSMLTSDSLRQAQELGKQSSEPADVLQIRHSLDAYVQSLKFGGFYD